MNMPVVRAVWSDVAAPLHNRRFDFVDRETLDAKPKQ